MKLILKSVFTVAILLSFLCLGGCPTLSEGTGSSSAATYSEPDPASIRTGMTKSQVVAIWGQPSSKQVEPGKEIWAYGGQRWKRMIPYAGPFINVQTSKVIFRNGRVSDYRLTDEGDEMSAGVGMGAGRFVPW